jgi:uncharacterized cupredoxin-like copper-binding protein
VTPASFDGSATGIGHIAPVRVRRIKLFASSEPQTAKNDSHTIGSSMTLKRMILTGLALLASSAAAADTVGSPRATRIEVGLDNFKFVPETVTLTHGNAYVLHLVNRAKGSHDFVAKEFFAAAVLAPQDRGAVKNGEVELHGGASMDVHFVATAAGTYEIHCSHFLHSAMGMTGRIVVQ